LEEKMKKTMITLALLLITVYTFAQTPEWQWATQAGGIPHDIGYSITVDDAGNTYVTGAFQSTAIFGSYSLNSYGSMDIFVAKMDAVGNWLWATQAGSIDPESGNSIVVDDIGNCYVTGYISETATFGQFTLISEGFDDIFVAKIDTFGNWLWASIAGGISGEVGEAITIDNYGCTYITGYYQETATFGYNILVSSGDYDIFVAKMDETGTWQWATNALGIGRERGKAITIDNAGNTYITGDFNNTVTFGTYTLTPSVASAEIFVAKMDVNGDWVWASQAEGNISNDGRGISIDDNGNTYITGLFQGTTSFGNYNIISSGTFDIFVAKLNAMGTWQWAAKAGGSFGDVGEAIITTNTGCSYVTGGFRDTATFGSNSLVSNGDYDIFAAKMDATGNWLWATNAGGGSDDSGLAITIDDAENTYVTGYFQETATFGSQSLTSSGNCEIFVAKLENDLITLFIADSTSGYYPAFEVEFSDSSSGFPTNWFWDFQNDGLYDSFEQNPTFTYIEPGIYDVKLKIYNETQVDSLIKYDYITVELVPPAAPENVQIEINGNDILLNWAEVDTTIFGTPIDVDYYLIYHSLNPYENFCYLGATPDTIFTHNLVVPFEDKMFYQIKSFIGTRQELEKYVERYLRKPEGKYLIEN
jgi:PKD repeat protein